MDPKDEIEAALRAALRKIAPEHADAPLLIERPRQAEHGDFSSNIALQLAKALKRKPRDLAQEIVAAVGPGKITAEIAGPGFINFRLWSDTRPAGISHILHGKERYGRAARANAQPGQGA